MIYTEERTGQSFDAPVSLYYHLTDIGLWTVPLARHMFPGAESSLIVRLDSVGALVKDFMRRDRWADAEVFDMSLEPLPFAALSGSDAICSLRHGQREISHGQREISHGQGKDTRGQLKNSHDQGEISRGQSHDSVGCGSTPSPAMVSWEAAAANNTLLNNTEINNTPIRDGDKEEARGASPVTPRIVSIAKAADGMWQPSSFKRDMSLWNEAVAGVAAQMTLEGAYDFVEWSKKVWRGTGAFSGLPYNMARVRDLTKGFLSGMTPEQFLESSELYGLLRPRMKLVQSEPIDGSADPVLEQSQESSLADLPNDLGGFETVLAQMDIAVVTVKPGLALASSAAEDPEPEKIPAEPRKEVSQPPLSLPDTSAPVTAKNDSRAATQGGVAAAPEKQPALAKPQDPAREVMVDGLGAVQRSELTRAISFLSPPQKDRENVVTLIQQCMNRSAAEIWAMMEPLYGREPLASYILAQRARKSQS